MRARAIAIPVLAVVLLALHAALYAGYVIDDAWISFRYARNLASGLGLVFQPGERVEGYTDFLWVLTATPFIALGIPVERAMAVFGLACAAATSILAVRRARQDDPSAPLAGLPTALVLALSHGVAFHAVAGLEAPLFSLLLLIAELALIDRSPRAFAVATTLAFLTRPEAALLGLGGTLLIALRPRGETRYRSAAVALATFVVLVTPYLAWKLAYFGALLPNTLHAKPPDPAAGLRYLARELGPFAGLVVAAIATARARSRAGDPRPLELTGIALALLGAVILAGGDWMPGGRMIVPHLAPLAIVADPAIRAWMRPSRDRLAWLRAIGAAVVLVIAPIQLARAMELSRGVRARQAIDAARVELAARLVRANVHRVALLDIGLLGWRAPSIEIIDLGGLVDPVIARAPGAHGAKLADLAYLETRAPDVVILTSDEAAETLPGGRTVVHARFAAERHIETSEWLSARYAYVETITPSPAYRMHLFERRSARPLTSSLEETTPVGR